MSNITFPFFVVLASVMEKKQALSSFRLGYMHWSIPLTRYNGFSRNHYSIVRHKTSAEDREVYFHRTFINQYGLIHRIESVGCEKQQDVPGLLLWWNCQFVTRLQTISFNWTSETLMYLGLVGKCWARSCRFSKVPHSLTLFNSLYFRGW